MLSRKSRQAVSTLGLLLGAAFLGRAGETRIWTQADYSDFEKGIIKDLSVRSDGVLMLAPRFQEIFDSSVAYLWTVAEDSKGNVYAGGGPDAKLFRIPANGKKETLAELEGMEVHAIAIDRVDRVYAATSPDGKVYRIGASGKPELFYDPKAKYIWALAFNSKGDLFIGTGDPGQVHRVSQEGKGGIFYQSDETHVRAMAVDANDNLILGTDPRGLVLRVSPSGQAFVMYQMGKREVTAVAVARDGSIYAAGVGNKQAGALPPSPAPPAQIPITGQPDALAARNIAPPAPPAGLSPGAPAVTGGSEVYRISAEGDPERLWSDPKEVVYTLAFDAAGHALIGTGNRGFVYRIDSPLLYTALLNAPPTQITALVASRDGKLYAASGNVGKLYQIGPGLERRGTIESDVFDSGLFSHWGRLSFEGEMNGGKVSLVARSGNLDQPQKNWSPWSRPITTREGDRIDAPPARFVQWKAILEAGADGKSPQVEVVDLAYLPKNVAPHVEEIEITPANYRFPPPPTAFPSPPTLSLPPLRKRPPATVKPASMESSMPAMQYAKGYIGARWIGSDENGDDLIYSVQIRGEREREWKPLRSKVREKYVSWDSTSFPDGQYRLRITVSDLPSNPPTEALSTHTESAPFLIDNTPPQLSTISATRNSGRLLVRWKAADNLNNIKSAEYSLDGGDWTVVAPVSGLSDSPELEYSLTLSNLAPGEHTLAVRVEDDYDNIATEKIVLNR